MKSRVSNVSQWKSYVFSMIQSAKLFLCVFPWFQIWKFVLISPTRLHKKCFRGIISFFSTKILCLKGPLLTKDEQLPIVPLSTGTAEFETGTLCSDFPFSFWKRVPVVITAAVFRLEKTVTATASLPFGHPTLRLPYTQSTTSPINSKILWLRFSSPISILIYIS